MVEAHHTPAWLRQEGGVYVLDLPMPFPLRQSNAFLAEGSDGWLVIDTGVNLPANQHIWRETLRYIGIRFRDIKAIYLTHYHHDHMGSAGWLQQMAQAPVFLSATDSWMATTLLAGKGISVQQYAGIFASECRKHGFNDSMIRELAQDVAAIHPLLLPSPELSLISPGDAVEIRGEAFEAISVPGHSDGHVVFRGRATGALFAGDALLGHYHIHLTDWPHTRSGNPMQEFLTAMEMLEGLGIGVVLPGHGPIVHDYPSRFADLKRHHRRRLLSVWMGLDKPATAYELAQKVMRPSAYIHIRRLALAETLAYLSFLEARGLVEHTVDNGEHIFRRRGPLAEELMASII